MSNDEYLLDTPALHRFVAEVRAVLANVPLPAALERMRPAFSALLADRDWLPQAYQQPVSQGGMGGGIATWLLYRGQDIDFSLFSLVVPPGATTPVHDHLAWGLVGLYAGEQDEDLFQRSVPTGSTGPAPLQRITRNHLEPGDFYVLLPPEGDIHSVSTTSAMPSVSIHLLGNDTGCIWRHVYEPADGSVRAFRSGWSNRVCAS